MRPVQVAALALTLALPAAAVADDRPSSVGPYAEVGIGGTGFLGEGQKYSAVGPSFSLRLGLDLFSWLSLGGRLGASNHEATVPAPPEGEYYQLYSAGGDARLGFRIGRIGVFADGGVGLAMMSTNVLSKVEVLDPGERFALVLSAGGGLEYQLQNRHYAFGLAGEWSLYGDFAATQTATARAYLRYTY